MAILKGMDELVIDDKKYVSSKQAAKLTGYAKDYVGQLCREGRVPARLVGRSWYVLESAIQDHRFGVPQEGAAQKSEQASEPAVTRTWEPPRYETVAATELPPIARRDEISNENEEEGGIISNESQPDTISGTEGSEGGQGTAQSAWEDWFALATDRRAVPPEALQEPREQEETSIAELPERHEAEAYEASEAQEEGTPIPIHSVYAYTEEEKRPDALQEGKADDLKAYIQPTKSKKRGQRGYLILAQGAGAVLALVLLFSALLGSGFVDNLAIWASQVHSLAGVTMYNK